MLNNIPTHISGNTLSEIIARIDSKGRLVIPEDLREDFGQMVVVKKTEEGILLRPTKAKTSKLERILDSKPRRTGKPENPKPEEMKLAWKE